MGGEASPRPPVANGGGWGVFSEDGRGLAWTGPILPNLIIATAKKGPTFFLDLSPLKGYILHVISSLRKQNVRKYWFS